MRRCRSLWRPARACSACATSRRRTRSSTARTCSRASTASSATPAWRSRARPGRCTFPPTPTAGAATRSPTTSGRACSCHGEPYVRQAAELARAQLRFEHPTPHGRGPTATASAATPRSPRRVRETVLPKMATCFGCHEHRDQWTLRDCDGCHVDLPRRGRAARRPPRARRRLRPRARRARGERARPLRELPHRPAVRVVPRRGHGPRAALEAGPRRREPLRASSRRLRGASRRRGARRSRPLHDVPHRELLRRLPHARERRRGRRRAARTRPGWANGEHGVQARIDPVVVRRLPRRRGRAALRRLPSRRRSGRQPARTRLREPQGRAPRSAVPPLPRGRADDADRAARRCGASPLAVVLVRRVRRGARQALAARAEGRAARSRPRVVGAVPHDARAPDARRRGEGRVPRLPRLRARRVQEPGHGGLHELPRQGERRSPTTAAPSSSTDCLTCHAFALGRTAPTCIGCHASAAGPSARPSCSTPRSTARRATACTRPRRSSPRTARAATTSARRSTPSTRARRAAVDCHRAHQPAAAATTACASCHAQAAQPHPAAHDACIGCHQPHDFVADDGACVGCHGAKTTLAEREVPAHAVCLNCHTPHAPGRGRDRVRAVPPGRPGDSRQRGGVRHLPRAPRRRSGRRRRPVHELPREGGRLRHGRARGRHRLRGVPQAARLRGARREDAVPRLPRARDHARRLDANPGHADCTSCHGASVVHAIAAPVGLRHAATPPSRSPRPPATSAASAATSRTPGEPDARVRHLPREQGAASRTPRSRAAARRCHRPHGPGRRRRLRLPARPATLRPRCPRFTRRPATPCARAATCRRTSRRAKTEQACTGTLPRGQARPPARRAGLHRVPRVPAMIRARHVGCPHE